jgi:hypothetical protein
MANRAALAAARFFPDFSLGAQPDRKVSPMRSLSLSGLLLATTALTLIGAPAWAQTPSAGSTASPAATAGAQPGVQTPVVDQDEQTDPEVPGADMDDAEPEDDNEVEAIVVRGNVPLVIRETAEVASVLTADDLARQGDDTAAAALTRVTGLSLVQGRFVYVRGLGERYSSALLNGSPLPSPEPLQRVVPLDLFPSSILANVLVQKTYSPNFPGEFGGGVIALTTVSVPNRPFLSLGVSVGGNTETTLKDGLGYYGSRTDFLGFDNGTRETPAELRLAQATGLRINETNFSPEELARIGRSFVNAPLNLLQVIQPEPNVGLDLSLGASTDTGVGRLGVVAVLGYDNSWQTREGVQQAGTIDQGVLRPVADYEVNSTQQNVDINALLGFGLEFGDSEIRFTNLFVRSTIKEARIREGVDELFSANRVRDDFTEFFIRTLVNHQLTGEHEFGDLSFDWRAAYAKASRDSPLREAAAVRAEPGRPVVPHGRTAQPQPDPLQRDRGSGAERRLRHRLRDRFQRDRRARPDGGLRLSRQRPQFRVSRVPLRGGGAAGLEPAAAAPGLLLRPPQHRAEPVADRGDHGAGGRGRLRRAAGGPRRLSDGDLEYGENLRASAGIRFEEGSQSVRPFDLFGGETTVPGTVQEEQYYLPAATVTYLFADGDMQVRAGASKTIARPQFRELAPSQFVDIDTDRIFFGNPFLRDSELTNYDARYEWYFGSREFVTAGVFYKTIDGPIEQVLNPAGSEIQTTFLNAPTATLYGAEFEVRTTFRILPEAPFFGSKRFLVGANYTYTKSEVEVGSGDVVFPLSAGGAPRPATEFFVDGQPLQGQSDHLANLQFGYEDEQARSQATLLLNYASERVSARGPGGQPDAIQDPGVQLDFTFRKRFDVLGRELSFGFEARNLLDEDSEEFQELGGGRIDLNRYDIGRSVSVSLGVTFGG